MTQEQKTKISEHFDKLHAIVSDYGLNVPNDIRDALRAAYLAGADYALDIYSPHWISVEERKPKLKHKSEDTQYSDTVIVTDGEYRTSASWVHNTWAGWYGWFTGGDEELKGVTHWMPLPQSPHHFADVSKMVKKGGEE